MLIAGLWAMGFRSGMRQDLRIPSGGGCRPSAIFNGMFRARGGALPKGASPVSEPFGEKLAREGPGGSSAVGTRGSAKQGKRKRIWPGLSEVLGRDPNISNFGPDHGRYLGRLIEEYRRGRQALRRSAG